MLMVSFSSQGYRPLTGRRCPCAGSGSLFETLISPPVRFEPGVQGGRFWPETCIGHRPGRPTQRGQNVRKKVEGQSKRGEQRREGSDLAGWRGERAGRRNQGDG